MTDLGVFRYDDAREIKRFVDSEKKKGPQAESNRRRHYNQFRPIVFDNLESEQIPDYGCIFSMGISADNSGPTVYVHQAKKPSTNLNPHTVMFNGLGPVEATGQVGDRGAAQQREFFTARYNGSAPTSIGALVGPVDGQWYLSEQTLLYTHRFIADLGDSLMLVRENKPSEFFRVVMTQTGGNNGDETQGNTFEYRVENAEGVLLQVDLMLNSGSPHDYETPELGEIKAATSGQAYFDSNGDLIIYHCNERTRFEACE